MKKLFKKLWVFIPLILAVGMYFLLPMFPKFTEYVCSRGLFKVITVPLGFITSLIPISLTEILVILILPIFVLLVVILLRKLSKSEHKGKTLLGAGKFVVGVCGILAFMYMACHGANYYRLPIEEIMELDTSQKSAEELYRVCVDLAKNAAEIRAELDVPEDDQFRFSETIFTELSRTNSGYSELVDEYPFLWTSIWRQKPVLLSEPWSYTGTTGVYCPILAECNVNTAQPDFSIPFTAAHESAHSRGIAFENECNFLAFVSCIHSEYAEYRYSGYMMAFIYCSSDLYSADYDLWLDAQSYLTNGMRMDFTANNDYIYNHEKEITPGGTTVSDISSDVNDKFIKSQGVSDGVESYNRVTDLILAYCAS